MSLKRLLNTLFIMTQGAYLQREGETIAVKVDRETKLRVPIITIGSIVCYGNVSMSPALMGFCAENGVCISFLSLYGRFLAQVRGPTSGNVLLRREQYRCTDDKKRTAAIIRSIVSAKVSNCRTVLLRALRDHGERMDRDKVSKAADMLKRNIDAALKEHDPDALRGLEGDSARKYFDVFGQLITIDNDDFSFKTRNRRPPLDPVNSLLSFVYTMLYHDMRSACETTGLDPAVGFLHRDRPGRMSLALDLMEEFRPFLADRLVLSLINLKQVNAGSFQRSESGAVLLEESARKEIVATYQKRKQDAIRHPYLGENMRVGILMQTQALLLARYLRGDIDGYPAFIWK
jgi:CRISPR-associated protein Cas1